MLVDQNNQQSAMPINIKNLQAAEHILYTIDGC
jgi:hypothetical protein